MGECVVLTQESSPRSHLALMGDPSLRMFVVAPPTGAVAAWAGAGVSLRWGPSPDTALGYHVYRADNPGLPVRRLTDRLLADTTFTDAGPIPVGARYLVRAVKLEVTASGSFYNPSQAAFVDAPAPPRLEGRSKRRSDVRPSPLRFR